MPDYNELLTKYPETLKNLSADTNRTPHFYMTSCEKRAVNFDSYIHKIANEIMPSSRPKSCDALVLINTDEYILIEFKNGRLIEKAKRNDNTDDDAADIREKILSGLLFLLDAFTKTINYSREKISFILVYNPENANKGQKSKSRDFLINRMKNFAYLRKYEKIFFKRVMIKSINEFETDIIPKIS